MSGATSGSTGANGAVAQALAPRFADLVPGAVFESFRRTVTETDIVFFTGWAGLHLPVFLDDDYARGEGPFGTRIAPGFLTASLSAGMMENILGPDILAGLGMDELRFTTPVRPGDTLRVRLTVLERRQTKDPGRGVVKVGMQVLNQRDECPLAYRATVMMRVRRDAA